MFELRHIQKISVLVVSGLFLAAGLIPIMNGVKTGK